MSKEARITARRGRLLMGAAAVAAAALALAGCTPGGASSSDSNGKVTLTFSQWWAPELPKNALQDIVDSFEKDNPNITVKLISAPFASLQTQTISQAASGTLPDVVGLDGAWVNPLYKQGALYNMSDAMKKANYDDSELASQVGFKGSTYMIPVVNFVYPLFTNDAILQKAGITTPPKTWTEFAADAKKISDSQKGVKGWVIPLGTTNPNGAQNDILSWTWASGGSMLKDGEPNLTDNPDVEGAVDMVKDLVESNAVLPGANSLQETDKVTNFINGRVGMMIDSLAHVKTITDGAKDLKFTVSAQPVKDGATGTPGMLAASWGIGMSAKTQHPAEAWKFIQYLMSKDVNSTLATKANGFPGNKTSQPDFSGADPHFQTAYEIYQKSKPVNEFTGLPSANELMTTFLVEFQKVTAGQQSTKQMLQNTQTAWKKQF